MSKEQHDLQGVVTSLSDQIKQMNSAYLTLEQKRDNLKNQLVALNKSAKETQRQQKLTESRNMNFNQELTVIHNVRIIWRTSS